MLRKLFALVGILASTGLVGCSMCQDCLDDTGPVPHAVNAHNFSHTPRQNSALGAPVEGAMIEGPIMESGEVETYAE